MDPNSYRQRLQDLERELNERISRGVTIAQETTDDQPDPVDQSIVDVLRDEYLGLAQTDTEILANVRLRGWRRGDRRSPPQRGALDAVLRSASGAARGSSRTADAARLTTAA